MRVRLLGALLLLGLWGCGSTPTDGRVSAPAPRPVWLPALQVSPPASELTGAKGDQSPLVTAPIPATPRPTSVISRGPPAIPILMYHYVRRVDPELDALGYGLSVSPATFAEHLQFLKQEGYVTIALDDLLDLQRPLPAKPIILSFDDGYRDAYAKAYPLLKQAKMQAIFYIVPQLVGLPAHMTWRQIRTLDQAGMAIGSHSLSHADLAQLSGEELDAELSESKTLLEQELGHEIVHFCYPSGKYTAETIRRLKWFGYRTAVTTQADPAEHDRFQLPRIRITGDMPVEELRAALEYFSHPPEAPGSQHHARQLAK